MTPAAGMESPRRDPWRLDGQVAVLTGARGNLGSLWCETLLDAGAAVLALDREDASPAPRYAALARERPAGLCEASADVRDRGALQRALELCRSTLGEPDALVCAAGIDSPPGAGERHTFPDLPLEAVHAFLDTNLLGTLLCTQVFGAGMAQRGAGSIVLIGSLYASHAPDPRLYAHLPGEPPFLKSPGYGAAKAGVVNLARYLCALWGPAGVRVNVLSPGGVRAGQDEEFQRKYRERVPLRRMAEPEDLAGPLLFLVSAASGYVSGLELLADGGLSAL
jgi:NAD(P)-dependent dehydrogenase (short-subunit alcohol dehydrogenase family)